jgi:hypothetical protein
MARKHRDRPASGEADSRGPTEERDTPDPRGSARDLVLGLALVLWPLAVVALYTRMLLIELGLVP